MQPLSLGFWNCCICNSWNPCENNLLTPGTTITRRGATTFGSPIFSASPATLDSPIVLVLQTSIPLLYFLQMLVWAMILIVALSLTHQNIKRVPDFTWECEIKILHKYLHSFPDISTSDYTRSRLGLATIPLEEIQIDECLNFITEPIKIIDRKVKRLK